MPVAGQLVGALVSYAAMGGVGYLIFLIVAATKTRPRRKQKQTTGENQP